MAGCSGENLEKAESSTEAMADGAGKIAAQNEVAQAQEARRQDRCMCDASVQGDARGRDEPGPGRNHNPRPRTNPDGNGSRSNQRCKSGKRADRPAHRPFRPQMLERFCGRCGAERCWSAFRCVEAALVLTAPATT
jgi:hypothetical protein